MRVDRRRDAEEEILETLPASMEEAPKALHSTWGVFEVLLKAPGRIDPFVRLPEMQTSLSFHFALITLLGLSLYALGLFTALYFVPQEALPELLEPSWQRSVVGLGGLLAAYPAGILLATLVVLPSYWFLGLLCGVKMTLGEVLTHSLKGKAATTALVLGLTPIYGVVLTILILAKASAILLTPVLWIGLLLPFVAAFRGAAALASGFRNVVATTPDLRRSSRESIPTSLMVLWALLFTLTAPVLMYRAWDWTTYWLRGG